MICMLVNDLHAGTISHRNVCGHSQKCAWSKMSMTSLVMGL